jgi:hypothetical protein
MCRYRIGYARYNFDVEVYSHRQFDITVVVVVAVVVVVFMKALQKIALLSTAHMLRKVLINKHKTFST